jgi:hypothetical protein
MTSTVSTKVLVQRTTASASSDGWKELIGAMPIVIFYRALREVFQRRAHKRAVLEAFRR